MNRLPTPQHSAITKAPGWTEGTAHGVEMSDVIEKWIVGGELMLGTCPDCDGEGGHEWVDDYRDPGARDAHGQRSGVTVCDTCDGEGEGEWMPHKAYVELARRTMDPTLTRKE